MKNRSQPPEICCPHCGTPRAIFPEIEAGSAIWTCEKCGHNIPIDSGGDENQRVMRNMMDDIERKRPYFFVKLKSLRQLSQLRKLLPELETLPLSQIRSQLQSNDLKWPIEYSRVAANSIRPFAEMLGLEIVSE